MNRKYMTLLITLFFCVPFSAHAVPCGETSTGVFTSAACQDGTTPNDSVTYLNDNSFFGINTWEFLDKVDYSDSDFNDTNFWSGNFQGTDGYFTLASDIWSRYDNLAVVLKGGNAYDLTGAGPVKWAAYSLVQDELDYTWIFGYNNNTTPQLKDISHMTIYGSGARPIPEPGTLLLFGAGLIGFGSFRKRRKKK